MFVVVMRTIASVSSWIDGSGTSSTRTSRLPCQETAFMGLRFRSGVAPRPRRPAACPLGYPESRSVTAAEAGPERFRAPDRPSGRRPLHAARVGSEYGLPARRTHRVTPVLRAPRRPRARPAERLGALALALLLPALAAAGCGSGRPGAPLPPAPMLPRSARSHVVVIVMENKDFAQVLGSRDAPYTNALARRYAVPTRMYATRHPSLPNYIALIGGATFGITNDCTDCHVAARNLVDLLEEAGVSWRAYMEDMPSACYRGNSSGGYRRRHNPFMYFDDVASSRRRCAKVVPYGRLASDL